MRSGYPTPSGRGAPSRPVTKAPGITGDLPCDVSFHIQNDMSIASSPASGHQVGLGHAVVAGVVTSVVGFTSSFAVVLAGLRHVGATSDEAASGLLVLCVTMGLGSILFSWRYRIPVTMAWSTPGAALLATASLPAGGFPTAVAAFGITGVLLALCGLVRPLGRAVAGIPTALANAMLAGVLMELCLQPFQAIAAAPAAVLPIIVVWLVLLRVARRWAVPGALAAAIVVIAVTGSLGHLGGQRLGPVITIVGPHWNIGGALALAIPLFVVTMTSQNIPGTAVLASFGYQAPLGPALVYTGAATAAGAVTGTHAINLAAISAALAAGPGAHPDPGRRWVAGITAGSVYLALGPLAALLAAVAAAAPTGVFGTIAGLALIGTFASAATAALADAQRREAAAVTFLVAASGLSVLGIGAAFWALIAGGLVLAVTTFAFRRHTPPSRPSPGPVSSTAVPSAPTTGSSAVGN